jgi:hypothetical protein|tara:strand:+ start:217 stop:825 length:609 start_codon:yes stop_codon:yes gene_type:complete
MAISIDGSNNTIGGVAVGGLPDGIVDTDMLAANAVTSAKSSGLATTNGITMVDSWVVTTSFTANGSGDITSNWARHPVQSWVGHIGSAMTESSGIFTFPSTGMYMVINDICGSTPDGARTYCGMRQYYSTDGGSSYNTASSHYSQGYNTNAHWEGSGTVIYDVSSTSNNKIKFNVETANTATVFGNAANKNTGVTFIRLGDT